MTENQNTPVMGSSLLAMTQAAAELEVKILALAEQKEGEIDDKLDELLADVETQIATKVDHYKFISDRLEMASVMLEQQADKFYLAAQSLENARAKLLANIKVAMQNRNDSELVGNDWKFKLVPAMQRLTLPKTVEEVPQEFIVTKTIHEVNKELLRARLAMGQEIAGCKLEPNFSLRTYINKGKI